MQNFLRLLSAFGLSALIAACGGGGGGGGGGGNYQSSGTPTAPTGDNVQAISVNGGLVGVPNLAFTSITVCIPNSTQCQTIDNIIIDTGSIGLRLVPSALGSLALPQQLNATGNPLFTCARFADSSHTWGPVRLADIKIAGMQANSVQIQTIGDVGSNTEPTACGGGDSSTNLSSVQQMGGNGLLGVGSLREDCGSSCGDTQVNYRYYGCPASGCTDSIADVSIQIKNPIALFATDNNGVIIQLPAISSSGAASANGWMIFGINTRDNNALGSAKVFSLADEFYINTTYNGTLYTQSFVDSGSNALFFPNTAAITTCPSSDPLVAFYCPTSPLNLSATISDATGSSALINFSVANASKLNGNFYAFANRAVTSAGSFDWGLPFFYGRKVYTAFETNSQGPYIAF